jgi:hypothetical protein
MGIEATLDIGNRIVGAIQTAAKATGAGFDYLLKTAMRESNLNPTVKAKTSSATGLFQFIDQTWLATMKESGASLGYGKHADAISRTSSGRYVVGDPAMRAEIMALRKDPTANSLMGGAFTQSNAKVLSAKLGRAPTDGELYIAHFLGASGAARFIRAAEANPNASAANYFPRAAQANRSIFYNNGGARTLAQTYGVLTAKHNATQVASVMPKAPVAPTVPVAPTAVAAAATLPVLPFKTVAPAAATAMTMNNAVPPVAMTAFAAEPRPEGGVASAFHGMFQTEQRRAVSPMVRELWGVKPVATTEVATAVAPAAALPATSAAPARVNAPLDLFRFLRPGIRGAA